MNTRGARLRPAAFTLALVMALFAMTGARPATPHVRATMKSPREVLHVAPTLRVDSTRQARPAGSGGTPTAETVTYTPPRVALPRPSYRLAAPQGRAPGADAYFGARPRSSRWIAIGGHGRNGAG